jgi:hypothetical protein
MNKRKSPLSLDLLNERALADFLPDESNDQISKNLQLLPLGAILDRPNRDSRQLNRVVAL